MVRPPHGSVPSLRHIWRRSSWARLHLLLHHRSAGQKRIRSCCSNQPCAEPYEEEEITLLEEEVIPAIEHRLARIEELDARLQQLSGFMALHLSGSHRSGLVLRRRIQVLGNNLLGDLAHAST